MAEAKNFIFEKIGIMLEKLDELKEQKLTDLDFEYLKCDYKETTTPPGKNDAWIKYKNDVKFSDVDAHYWIHLSFEAVEPVENKELIFRFKTGREKMWDATNPQGIIYTDGRTVQALDVNHTWTSLEFGRKYDLYIYLYTGTWGGSFEILPELWLRDIPVYNLYFDIEVPFEALEVLERDSYNYIKIRDALNQTCFRLDLRHIYSDDFYQSIAEASKYIKEEFYEKICGNSEATVSCIGHTHIDVAWLWTVRQTREKAERSFSTALNLMRKYPEYKFMSSQPQLYQFVKKANPELYEEIKERVREGRWEVEGAMWLEADCNLISGESMVRQIMYGKRFMKKEFGVESRILWLPDVFGYSAALPQILKKSGVERFFTTKIAWSEYNTMPHDTFMWRGIDGTKIFASFTEEYVEMLEPGKILDTWKNYKDKSLTNETLVTFGYGDGGGGSTAEMMERHLRLKKGLPGIPKTVIKKAGDFFDDIEKDFIKNTKRLRTMPKWDGELYLEMHRGTYTSMAKNKKNNRQSEFAYQTAETLSVFDMLLFGGDYDYDTMHKNQVNILLNQFHDIIPGSSIKEVYDVTDKEYAVILADGRRIIDEKLSTIKENIKTDGGLFVYNPTPFDVSTTVESDGRLYIAENVPAHGYRVIIKPTAETGIKAEDKVIENDVIRITFNDNFEIVSVFDKAEKREIISQGETANRLEIYEDYPRAYDAWEITNYYKDKMWSIKNVESVEYLKNGIRIKRNYQKSTFMQDIIVHMGSKRIDFVTEVDWHEDHVLLKTVFPVDIHSSHATYDIQFGNVERPTNYNTSWEEAKFEVCGHKWADLSEGGYGVSLMNDCKYGYGIHENVMTLSLLKAAAYPNPEADRGINKFTYSLYPHTNNFADGNVVQESYILNMPLEASFIGKTNGNMPEVFSLVKTASDHVALETVKKAEDNNSVILRLYEFANKKGNIEIELGFDFKELYLCDLMENNIEKLSHSDNKVQFYISNYEIVTLKAVV